jgi:CRP-like cAMP-binding protein
MIRVNKTLLAYMARLQRMGAKACATEHVFRPGNRFVEQERPVSAVYIIKSGLAKCSMTEDNGNEFIQEFFGEGELLGEVEAIKGTLSFCSIEAISELVVYKIGFDEFNRLLATDKVFTEYILAAMATKIRYKALRHGYNQSHTIEDNFLRLKSQYPPLMKIIAKQDVANYLGVSLRSLNRTLRELKDRGLDG